MASPSFLSLFIIFIILPFATSLSCYHGFNFYSNPNQILSSPCDNEEDTCTIIVITNSSSPFSFNTQFSCSNGCPNNPQNSVNNFNNNFNNGTDNNNTLSYVQCCQEDNCNMPNNSIPSYYDCNYYPFGAEMKIPCGINGYPLAYGMKYCILFNNSLDSFSSVAKTWIENTRHCLQVSLENIISEQPNITCSNLKTTAFQSHVACYTSPAPNSSVCDLSISDYLTLLSTIKKSFITDTVATIKQMAAVFSQCLFSSSSDIVSLEFDSSSPSFSSFSTNYIEISLHQIISKVTGFPSDQIMIHEIEKREKTTKYSVIFVADENSSMTAEEGAKNLINSHLSSSFSSLSSSSFPMISGISSVEHCPNASCYPDS